MKPVDNCLPTSVRFPAECVATKKGYFWWTETSQDVNTRCFQKQNLETISSRVSCNKRQIYFTKSWDISSCVTATKQGVFNKTSGWVPATKTDIRNEKSEHVQPCCSNEKQMFSTRSRDHEMMKSQDISNLKKRKVATYPCRIYYWQWFWWLVCCFSCCCQIKQK